VEKWLKVPEVLIVKGAKGAEWVLKVLTGCWRCRLGAGVLSRCWGTRVLGASTYPLAFGYFYECFLLSMIL
jgi:hypothetical protein